MENFQQNNQESSSGFHQTAGGDSASWYAVQTHARSEKAAARHLQMKGVEVFLPLVSSLRRWSDRNKRVDLPLFPGYEFVRISPAPRTYYSVLQTPGIARFVGRNGEDLLSIPDKEIEDIQRALATDCQCSEMPFFKAGQRIRIRGGCLDGLEGILLAENGKQSLVVSVELIHRSVAISIEGFDAEIVDSPDEAAGERR